MNVYAKKENSKNHYIFYQFYNCRRWLPSAVNISLQIKKPSVTRSLTSSSMMPSKILRNTS